MQSLRGEMLGQFEESKRADFYLQGSSRQYGQGREGGRVGGEDYEREARTISGGANREPGEDKIEIPSL